MSQPSNQQFSSDRQPDRAREANGYSSELRDSLGKLHNAPASRNPNPDSVPETYSYRSQRKTAARTKLSPQILAIALALTTLPPLAIATATYFSHKSLERTVALAPTSAAAQQKLQRETNYLLLISWLAAIIAGGASFWAVRKTLAPILDAAAISTMLVRRLRIQQLSSTAPASARNVLSNLAENMQNLGQRLPDLLVKQESTHEMLQALSQMTSSLRNAASEAEILKVVADLVRQAFHADRALIFRYERYPQGTFAAEATASGSPRLLWSTIDNYPTAESYVQGNSQSPVIAADNLWQASLSDEELNLCQQLGVKAFLTAPIYREGKLFGLMMVHQCHTERMWQPLELDLLAQITNQLGLALESAKTIEQVEERNNLADIFIKTTQIIRASLDEAEVLTASVEAVRKVIGSERVIVYGFDDSWYGTVLAESMSSGYPRMLWAGIYDPCFAEGFVEQYQAGRVKATNDVYEAGMGECYLKQLAAFGVKANLVAPILKDGSLFGLLIAHQCSAPRVWQQWEIDWFAQIATQIGYALDHARLLKRIEREGQRSHLLTQLTQRIRGSMEFAEIVKIGTEEARKAISADRVILLTLEPDHSGNVVSESVSPGLPHAIAQKFQPSWMPQSLKQAYQRGQAIAIDDVFKSQMSSDVIQMLQRLGVKSSLAAPILLQNDNLFGLLVAHQCTQIRQWESHEIDMFAQIATQIGCAIEPAQVVERVEREYQSTASATIEQRHQLEELEQQLLDILERSHALAQGLQNQTPENGNLAAQTSNQIKNLANLSQKIVTAAEQTKMREQHISEILQVQFNALYSLQAQNSVLRDTDNQAVHTVQQIQPPVDRLSESLDLISQITNQLKLQSVNVALEVSRYGGEGQKLREIAEKVMNYLRQLETDLQEVKPLVENIQQQSQTAVVALHNSAESALISSQLLASTHQEFERILAVTHEIGLLADDILQSATEQSTNLIGTSENAIALAENINGKGQPSEFLNQIIEQISSSLELLRSR